MAIVHFVSARSIALAATFFGGSVLALVVVSKEEPTLSAAVNFGREDMDKDGLTDLQEMVLGTFPDRADTDADSFSDLEEVARRSDPRDRNSIPGSQSLQVGTCASVEDGVIRMVSAVYVDGGELSDVDFEFGIVLRGEILRVSPRNYRYSRAYLYRGQDQSDRVVAIEVAVPESAVQQHGQLNLFAVARGTGAQPPTPAVGLLTLVDFSGVTVSVEERLSNYLTSDSSNTGSRGVVYRPLGGDEQLPSSWSGGQICFQRTAPVGTNGSSIVHEVTSAECQSMDTFCSSGDCSAGVGTALEIPNPATLAGG